MNDQPHLVTTCTFKDKDYLVKMIIINGNSLDLCVTDKYTSEDWQCTYDAAYIENLTHKTGNFKQFDIFTTMLRSGLLKTSDCITLDLLTFDDLEQLRSRRTKARNFCTPRTVQSNHLSPNANRRYLILTYTVEFDRIHYPLPMDYCGPPEPHVLQATIRRLEGEVTRLQEQLQKSTGQKHSEIQLKKRIEELAEENQMLVQEVQYLNTAMTKQGMPSRDMVVLQNTVKSLEENVLQERFNFQRIVKRLREDKVKLMKQVEELTVSERSLRSRMQHTLKNGVTVARSGTARRPGDGQQLVSSRHPGDGIGSPGLKLEQFRSKTQLPSPNCHAKLYTKDKFHPTNSVSEPKCQVTQSPSVDCHCTTTSARNRHQRRSSSESSVGSRKCSVPQGRKIPNYLMRTAANIHFVDDNLLTRPEISRGRPKERERIKAARSTSGSSVGSASARTKAVKSSGSRHSSISSTASCCHQSEGSGHFPVSAKMRRHHKKNASLRFGITDLERRIQALQKVLKEGLAMK